MTTRFGEKVRQSVSADSTTCGGAAVEIRQVAEEE
jgi:hypothetical protein